MLSDCGLVFGDCLFFFSDVFKVSFDLVEEFEHVVVAVSAEGAKIFVGQLFLVELDKILLLDSVDFFGLFRDQLSLFLLNVLKKFCF